LVPARGQDRVELGAKQFRVVVDDVEKCLDIG